MKRIITTISALTISTLILLFACQKDELPGKSIGYANQNGGTGANPNAGGAIPPSTKKYYGSITVATNPADSITIVNCGSPNEKSYQTMGLTSSNKSCIIAFDTITVYADYVVTTNSLGPNKASIVFNQNSVNYYGQSGVVHVRIKDNIKTTFFSNVVCIGAGKSISISASITCP